MLKLKTLPQNKIFLDSEYESIYTEKVKPSGNSAKINCKKKYLNRDVIIVVLKNKKEDNNGKQD